MIIGFVGRARSGKDSAVRYLQEKGVLEENVKFATWLKLRCADMFGLPLSLLNEGDRTKPFPFPFVFTAEHYMKLREEVQPSHDFNKMLPIIGRHLLSPRHMLQFIGTDVVRAMNPEWHVTWTFGNIDQRKNIGISDVRFGNEIQGIRRRGGFVVYINRDTVPWEVHSSEHIESLSGLCDFHISNNGTLEEFNGKLDALVETLKKEGT
jgi:hypothetical protein